MTSPRDRMDEQATHELDEEAERHRQSLDGLKLRDTARLVEEASRHFDRVQAIMRALAIRTVKTLPALAAAAAAALVT